jgi:hypothetical protein
MRGIVTSAGGPTYFLNAYLNFRLLREAGCRLPIEWFYLGAEMKPAWIALAARIEGVTLRDLAAGGIRDWGLGIGERQSNPHDPEYRVPRIPDYSKDRGGWQSKIEAIVRSSFDEVLFLDADCFPLRDPGYLFDGELYRRSGAVLWPDIFLWDPDQATALDKRYGITLPERQIESGQLMFDKRRCAAALDAVRRLNARSEETYRLVYGDKDTFLIGFLQTRTPFAVVPHLMDHVPGGYIHKDFEGRRLLAHLVAGGKFQTHGRPFVRDSDFPAAPRAREIIAELVASDEWQVTSEEPPAASHSSPVTRHQSLVTSHSSPVTRHQSLVTNH